MNITDGMEFNVFERPYLFGYEVFIRNTTMAGGTGIVKPIVMEVETVPAGQVIPSQPALTLDRFSMQSLMDAMWKAGIRPNNGESSLAHIEAMSRHLEDMRLLAGVKEAVIDGSPQGNN